jgi:hypothetical protein
MISGRISDSAVHPRDKKTWYIAVAAGGRVENDERRHHWTPGLRSAGRLLDRHRCDRSQDPNVVWVGHGGNNATARRSRTETGSTKSVDGGPNVAEHGTSRVGAHRKDRHRSRNSDCRLSWPRRDLSR